MHVATSFVRNLGGLSCPDFGRGRFRKAKSRTLNMYAGEKSDSAIVPEKRSNNGRQLPAEDVEERAGPKGNSRRAAAVRTQSRGAASIRLAVVRRAMSASKPLKRLTFDLREEPGALAAHAGICAGGAGKPAFLPRTFQTNFHHGPVNVRARLMPPIRSEAFSFLAIQRAASELAPRRESA